MPIQGYPPGVMFLVGVPEPEGYRGSELRKGDEIKKTPTLVARLSVQWVLGGWERAGTDPPDCKGFEH